MTNQRERQTYFGALNYQTKKFFVQEYEAGNSKNTVLFVKYLQNLNKGARILIFWDGASYHKYAEMREYLGVLCIYKIIRIIVQRFAHNEWPFPWW